MVAWNWNPSYATGPGLINHVREQGVPIYMKISNLVAPIQRSGQGFTYI
jgi:hypothetical protein